MADRQLATPVHPSLVEASAAARLAGHPRSGTGPGASMRPDGRHAPAGYRCSPRPFQLAQVCPIRPDVDPSQVRPRLRTARLHVAGRGRAFSCAKLKCGPEQVPNAVAARFCTHKVPHRRIVVQSGFLHEFPEFRKFSGLYGHRATVPGWPPFARHVPAAGAKAALRTSRADPRQSLRPPAQRRDPPAKGAREWCCTGSGSRAGV